MTEQETSTRDSAARDLKLAFADARERGEALRPWLDRYPQYARELIDLAIVLDAAASTPVPDPNPRSPAAAALRETLERLRAFPPTESGPGLLARVRSAGLSFAKLAPSLRVPVDVLHKLDRGMIALDSVPRRLLAQLAAAAQSSTETLVAALPKAPVVAGALYRAAAAPEPGRQQTFAEAVRNSPALAEDDRQYWLTVLREEGLPV